MDEHLTLRELCLNALAESEVASEKIRRLLALNRENVDSDDLTYAIMFELEMLHREQDLRLQSEVKRNEMMLERITHQLEQHQEKMLKSVTAFQVFYRVQFRRLIAIHRERFANKLVFVICVLLLGGLAGVGGFHLYRLWWME